MANAGEHDQLATTLASKVLELGGTCRVGTLGNCGQWKSRKSGSLAAFLKKRPEVFGLSGSGAQQCVSVRPESCPAKVVEKVSRTIEHRTHDAAIVTDAIYKHLQQHDGCSLSGLGSLDAWRRHGGSLGKIGGFVLQRPDLFRLRGRKNRETIFLCRETREDSDPQLFMVRCLAEAIGDQSRSINELASCSEWQYAQLRKNFGHLTAFLKKTGFVVTGSKVSLPKCKGCVRRFCPFDLWADDDAGSCYCQACWDTWEDVDADVEGDNLAAELGNENRDPNAEDPELSQAPSVARTDVVTGHAVERRIAPDGRVYTQEEFVEFFGALREWDAAAVS
eukprot:TRINITY_DN24128_c0_g1_i1.p1 TRINITY_DN24128_c0_g1~~TRINITY_DN24128_c0_g1_i1.p1  ORF type:complete len:368 (-),score=39.75 TRINITY_DN24128_c0_g1_i1:408-1412(-)